MSCLYTNARRTPTVVLSDVISNEFCKGSQILGTTPELWTVLLGRRARVAGAHGVDEDEVGGGQPGLVVVFEVVRRRWHATVREEVNLLRAEAAKVQPARGGTRATVKAEAQRPGGRIAAVVQRVCTACNRTGRRVSVYAIMRGLAGSTRLTVHEEHRSGRACRLVQHDGQQAGPGLVLHRCALHLHRVGGHHGVGQVRRGPQRNVLGLIMSCLRRSSGRHHGSGC